jgi:hypothetical protein
VLKWIGGILGFVAGFIGTPMLFAYLAVRFKIDVFHTYIVEPVPPPGGYRTLLDVPPATWPLVAVLGVAILLAKGGAVLGTIIGRKVNRQSA